MRVCYFGSYSQGSLRTVNNIKALRKAGVDVVECWDRSFLALRYPRLIRKLAKLHYDVMIIGWYGHSVLPLAKLIANKPIVLDAFIGLYETEVDDRKNVACNSLKAKFYYYADKVHFNFADLCISDTAQHIDYFCKQFNSRREKFRRVFVTTDDEFFYPGKSEETGPKFSVLFEGGYTPLHGIEHIIKAAKILENYSDITFELIGAGQTYAEIRHFCKQNKIKNISFQPWMDYYTELPKRIQMADLCLGIFSEGAKASRVIPTKAIDALATKKPLITGDSLAAREILKDAENCMLVPVADPEALAEAILTLKKDKKLRNKIAENGYTLFKNKLSLKATGEELKSILTNLIEENN
jgi:glycosyltransferase involved in cell wall biosynthesis